MKFIKIIATILFLVIGFAPAAVMLADVFWWILTGSVLAVLTGEQVIVGIVWTVFIGAASIGACATVNEWES